MRKRAQSEARVESGEQASDVSESREHSLPVDAGDQEVIDEILAGNEAAFNLLLQRHHAAMIRLARGFVGSQASAEEVVQESWIGVLRGLERFEGRSALKTWIFRILVNRCITRRKKEGRRIPFSSIGGDDAEPAVDPSRFSGRGTWGQPPEQWDSDTPERILMRREAMGLVEKALEDVPERQRIVVIMRDVEGFTSEDVCNALDISASNQRVLLHRGRTKVRRALEDYISRSQS